MFLFISLIIVAIIILYLIYFYFIGPTKLEIEIIKGGGNHPCFYCKKEINIKEDKCKHCKKLNYKGLRKGRIKYFLILVFTTSVGLTRLYDKLGIGKF